MKSKFTASLAVIFFAVSFCGCGDSVPPRKEVHIQPLIGGIGGMILQVVSPDGVVNLYHLPPDGMNLETGSETTANLPLFLRTNVNNASDTLPVTIGGLGRPLPKTSTVAALKPNEQVQAKRPKEVVVEKIVEVEKEVVVEKIVEVEKLVPREVDTLREIDVTNIPNAYVIKAEAIEINDGFIKDIQMRSYATFNSKMHADITVENSSKESWHPAVELIVLNRYGIKLGGGRGSLGLFQGPMQPRERKIIEASFLAVEEKDMFKYSLLGPVENFETPYCIVVKHNRQLPGKIKSK